MNYFVNRTWSDRFLPDFKRIVGGHLLETAADFFDLYQATDLMMLDARDMRIAARSDALVMISPHRVVRFEC